VVRATNWIGDGVMSMPALQTLRKALPHAHVAVLVRPEVGDLYRQSFIDEVIPWTARAHRRDVLGRWRLASRIRRQGFDAAILLQNAFDAALVMWLARIPVRIGYDVNRRRALLTHPVPATPTPDQPAHQSTYYINMLQRAGIVPTPPERVRPTLPPPDACCAAHDVLAEGSWIGVAPGSSNGHAKRWLPERFAEASAIAARTLGSRIVLLGSNADKDVCARVEAALRSLGTHAVDLSGSTSVSALMRLTAACDAVLANDSGSMHIADALGVPTVAVFGPTCERSTGPTGPHSVAVRQQVECSPCLLHECPIDHRCMTGVDSTRVAAELIRVAAAGRASRQSKVPT
jgi:heptosyltransferase-2